MVLCVFPTCQPDRHRVHYNRQAASSTLALRYTQYICSAAESVHFARFFNLPLHCMHLKQNDAESSAQHPTGKGEHVILFCLGCAPRKQASYWHAMHAPTRRRLPSQSPAAALERARETATGTPVPTLSQTRADTRTDL